MEFRYLLSISASHYGHVESSETLTSEEVLMSTTSSAHAALIERLRSHLKAEGYSPSIQRSYPTLARHFLDYYDTKGLKSEAVCSAHLTEFLRRR